MAAPLAHGAPLVRALAGAVAGQAALSAASFLVGLMLIRRASDGDYGAYVIVIGLIALATSLQNACVGPVLGLRMPHLAPQPRGALIGGLYVAQCRVLGLGALLSWLALAFALALGWLDGRHAAWVTAGTLAGAALLAREYFRRVLYGHGLPLRVARHDLVYGACLVLAAALAAHGPWPGLGVLAVLAAVGLGSAWRLAAESRRHEAWAARVQPRLWAEQIAPLALWSSAGATIQWVLSQGQLYLVAALLDVSAVAAVAATRMLLMPANLLSTGIGSMMLPRTVTWLASHGLVRARQRVLVLAAGVALLSLAYALLLWLNRERVYTQVLHRQDAGRDTLLLLWTAIVLVTGVRDQLAALVSAQARFRALTLLTSVSALTALAAGWWALHHLGVAGALVGLLAGEGLSLAGVVWLSSRSVGRVPA
ncbi:polysaccharide biosynthesis protein [Leptothrix discophora]|uniref:Polysaccharide biosynthesis protein n=1 Tax=Leptothrix discophora TaxID=89 RepID=A0ABT9G8T1_LEPDI|nr:hypothetical protein [Leptothrix discophora]MDP4302820.1 hypothetical protein [Leptothrix discophora]